MSTLQVPERPAFNSLEPGLDTDLAPPVSPLAVLAMVLGIFSLVSAIAVSVVPFAIVVAVLCAALIWKLSWDTGVGGMRLAQIGLWCSVFGATWGLTTTRLTEAYFYSQAAEHAKVFLQTLSAGKQYEAFELTQPEQNRLVTGTDIAAHYEGLMASDLPTRSAMMVPDMNQEEMPSPETMKNSRSKEELEAFIGSPSTKEVMAHGKDADWKFVRGESVLRMDNTTNRVDVIMVDSAKPSKKYSVSMNRVTGQFMPQPGRGSVAIWDVDRVKAVKE
ncbi:MAG: hypothetical protein SFV81_16480 [Pirellulaceae bacterium]|nr:hypothetical protein [Pirellulaceae bacterium]